MEQFLESIGSYLSSHAVFTLFVCLGMGYILGKVKVKTFVVGATMGTLLMGILISQLAAPEYGAALKSVLYYLFCFTLGFDVGPAFFSNFKSSGVKIMVLSVIFAALGLGITFLLCYLLHMDKVTGVGLMAGALTQTSIIEVAGFETSDVAVVYGITYTFGTLGVILFAKNIAPLVLRKPLAKIAKEKVDKLAKENGKKQTEEINETLQVRAYMLKAESVYCGMTTEQFEEKNENRIEVEAVYRGEQMISMPQEEVLLSGDVIQIVGDVGALDTADDRGLSEVTEPKYYQIQLVDAKIVLTDNFEEKGRALLSEHGVLLRSFGKKVSFQKNSIISVKGPAKAIKNVAKTMGYVKEEGNVTDIAFLALAIAVGVLIGSLKIVLKGFPLGLGESVGVLLIGLLCGWWYERKPRMGNIPPATRLFLKSLGLNLYIAVVALGIGSGFMEVLKTNGLQIILCGIAITLTPHLLSLLIGKYILRIDEADLLGGLCGSGTCTAGLNALTDETGSSVFTLGYAPGCAAGNILLTLAGLVLSIIM